jgi:hypothetical protein
MLEVYISVCGILCILLAVACSFMPYWRTSRCLEWARMFMIVAAGSGVFQVKRPHYCRWALSCSPSIRGRSLDRLWQLVEGTDFSLT